MAISKMVRNIVKLSTSGAVQAMIGGVTMAVMPTNINALHKAVNLVGGLMISWYVGEKLEGFTDEKLDDIENAIDEVKAMAAEAKKSNDTNVEEQGA